MIRGATAPTSGSASSTCTSFSTDALPISASGFRRSTYGDSPAAIPTLQPCANPVLVARGIERTGRSAIAPSVSSAEALSTTITETSARLCEGFHAGADVLAAVVRDDNDVDRRHGATVPVRLRSASASLVRAIAVPLWAPDTWISANQHLRSRALGAAPGCKRTRGVCGAAATTITLLSLICTAAAATDARPRSGVCSPRRRRSRPQPNSSVSSRTG